MLNNILFAKHSFSYYVSLLKNSDNRTIIVGLQEIFFNLKKGYVLTRYQRRILEPLIIEIISNNNDTRVRRWAYMVGAFCINEELVRVSLERLEQEDDFENRTWIMSILAYNLKEEDFNRYILRLNHGLSEENIKLSTYLFSNNYKYRITSDDVHKAINKNDKISLFWIGSIAAYTDLAKLRRKEILIPDDVISDLTNHDDDEILKHIMYAYSFKKRFSVKDELKFDYYNYENMQLHHKKWFLTAIWKDKKFIQNNIEYVKEILAPNHLFLKCDKRVREGLARGLSEYEFDKLLVRSVLEWISYETEISVLYFLWLYIIKCQDFCKEYKEIISEELMHGDQISKNAIFTFSEYFNFNKEEHENKVIDLKINANSEKSGSNEENLDNNKQGYKKVFVSYSWTPESNKKWVRSLVEKLQQDGVRVIVDFLDLNPGHDKFAFTERAVSDQTIDKVLIICNKTYKEKADERKGGVGDESTIISPYMYGNANQEKFIPIVNELGANEEVYLPNYLKSRIYIDMVEMESGYINLINNIKNSDNDLT